MRPAIDGAMMNANRGQGQVRSTNGYLIDSVNDQGKPGSFKQKLQEKLEIRPMDKELIKKRNK